MDEKIQEYWEQRAVDSKINPKISSTNDTFFRDLENQTILNCIKEKFHTSEISILDAGCGDGATLAFLKRNLPGAKIYGIDYAPSMIKLASTKLRKYINNAECNLICGDMFDINQISENFDVIISGRSLINLSNNNEQLKMLKIIRNKLNSNSRYIGLENFTEPLFNLNKSRNIMGLPDIKILWHNSYLSENETLNFLNSLFKAVKITSFGSSYYFATRVVYSSLCKINGNKIDYQHPVHQYAVNLPYTGDFCPTKLISADV